MKEVIDPAILSQLEGLQEVTDPEILAQLGELKEVTDSNVLNELNRSTESMWGGKPMEQVAGQRRMNPQLFNKGIPKPEPEKTDQEKWDEATAIQDPAERMKAIHNLEGLKAPFIQPEIDIPLAIATGGTSLGFKQGIKAGAKALTKDIAGGLSAGVTDIAIGAGKGIAKAVRKPIGLTDNLLKTTTDKDVLDVLNQFQKDERQIKELRRFKFKEFKDKLGVKIWDDTANIRKSLEKVGRDIQKKINKGEVPIDMIDDFTEMQKSAENAVMKRALVRGSSAKAVKIIDDVDKAIFKDMTQGEIHDLNRIRESLRTIEISPRGIQSPGGIEAQKHLKMIQEYKAMNPDAFAKLVKKTNQIQEIYSDQLKQLFDNGLLDKKNYDNIIAKGEFYNPRRYLQHIDPGMPTVRHGKKVTVGDSGLAYLEEGSQGALEKDSRLLLQDYVARIQSRIARNDANKALYDFAQKNPDNEIVQIVKKQPIRETKNMPASKVAPQRKATKRSEVFNDPIDRMEDHIYDSIRNGDYTLEEFLADPSSYLDNQVAKISSMQQRVLESRIKKSFSDEAIDQEVLRLIQQNEAVIEDGIVWQYDKIPSGYDTVNVMRNGKKERMILPNGLSEEWKGLDPILTQRQAHIIGTLSGNKLLKAFATGINPAFAIRNIARDIGYVYMSPEYSAFLPKFTGQIMNNYRKTFKDALLKKGAYAEYIRQGGGMDTLTKQGRLFEKHLEKTQNVLGALGDFSERWTRLAHRNRAIMNGKSEEMATFIARDALDFSQGGTWAKAADSAVPYLNAGIQGTRGFIKFARKDPKKFAYKLANLAGVSTGIYYWNTIHYKEDYDKIDPRVKANNWIIMTPLTYKDKNGDIQRRYTSIPKDQSQRIFTALFENIAAKAINDEVDYDQIGLAAKDLFALLPTGESYLPPSMKASLGYSMNKDFWRNDDIWKPKYGEEYIKPYLESNIYTPEIYKKFGSVTGMSPARTKYAVEQFFTSSNSFTEYFGLGLNGVMKAMSSDEQVKASEDIVRTIPGLRVVLKGTTSDYKLLKKNKEIKEEVHSENVIRKREQDIIFRAIEMKDNEKTRNMMRSWLSKQPKLKQEYLGKRYEQFMEVKGVDKSNWKWWMDLAYETDPKAQALMFHNKWKKLNATEKDKLIKRLGQLDGTKRFNFSKNFWAEFQSIKKGDK